MHIAREILNGMKNIFMSVEITEKRVNKIVVHALVSDFNHRAKRIVNKVNDAVKCDKLPLIMNK